MSTVFGDYGWHSGERNMQRLVGVNQGRNPTNWNLSPRAAQVISSSSLIAVGTTSSSGEPWASLLTGMPGFMQYVSKDTVAAQTVVPIGDPIYGSFGDEGWGEDVDEGDSKGEGMIAGLAIDLEHRLRQKFYGKSRRGMRKVEMGMSLITFVISIEQSMGNCPKYINTRRLEPVPATVPANLTDKHEVPTSLPQEALDLIARSDMFFVASRNGYQDMDVNHRGGPPGFVRVLPSAPEAPTTMIWPEYSGNRLYQTLGNLQITPLAGLTFPDYNTGDMLYLTGKTEILVGEDAEKEMNRCKLAVKFTVTSARYSKGSLGLRLADPEEIGWSPYNPTVRLLKTEEGGQKQLSGGGMTARLIKSERLADTIARFTFQLSGKLDKKELYKAGQYVMLNFEEELSVGYRHMDDSDPQGLNDDYVRSFTVSSRPDQFQGSDDGKFQLTIRRNPNGAVTRYLFQQGVGANLEVPVQGFGGEFFMEKTEGGKVGIIAAGVGITPFMAQWQDLQKSGADVRLFWAMRGEDVKAVKTIVGMEGMEGMKEALRLFVTGNKEEAEGAEEIAARVEYRRLEKADLIEEGDEERKWYICTGLAMQKQVIGWLDGRYVSYEEFTY
ncbi:hypothetical protein H072_4998 [Dactylellina haptotyla CBS 200.50]|uniref:FAD-binding FR-type domain-containing protein n=1 Tax=Dactylellina haptotyla (strain CBS 200.50) TaxID=1284197 RepID=S8ADY1_DACHA|nr:hypothetical protein H072_4998 [Dactylellina haptotyla CBS 200.50]